MKQINFRRMIILAGLVSMAIIYAGLWVRMITTWSGRTGADFIAFYAAGRISLTGNFAEAYVPEAQQAVEESVVGFPIAPEAIAPFVHPPFILAGAGASLPTSLWLGFPRLGNYSHRIFLHRCVYPYQDHAGWGKRQGLIY